MSKVKISGNASGTGVLTIEAPNTNTNRTLTLPDTTGTLVDTTGATFTGGVTGTDVTLSGGVYVGGTGSANYLDDYETGTWTPSYNNGSQTLTVSYNAQSGGYTKIGNTVFAWFDMQVDGTISGSDALRLWGLPFPCGSGTFGGLAQGFLNHWDGDRPTIATVVASATYAELSSQTFSAGTKDHLIASDIKNLARWRGCITYQVA